MEIQNPDLKDPAQVYYKTQSKARSGLGTDPEQISCFLLDPKRNWIQLFLKSNSEQICSLTNLTASNFCIKRIFIDGWLESKKFKYPLQYTKIKNK